MRLSLKLDDMSSLEDIKKQKTKIEIIESLIRLLKVMRESINLNSETSVSKSTVPAVFDAIAQTGYVPTNLPYFQWKGYVVDRNHSIYSTPDECVREFENILNSYSLSVEGNWRRSLLITAPIQIIR
ncbi:hypothetical protein A0J61_07534 [Choanephora cucurbitarum]|uniref:Uncharacterized protein n=1 Tax=Choanephora cucurbitarum TaxID=101091 RepID=A0A1C7N6Z2_9FUNG|nr:hypothetical protein A0J61_07534 [Choanephora cucurbitarum]